MTQPNHAYPDKVRLKEAIWRIQGNVGAPGRRLSRHRSEIIDRELELLADALGVTTLDRTHPCPYCGHVHPNTSDNEV